MDRDGKERKLQLTGKVMEACAAMASGDNQQADQITKSIFEHYGRVEPWPATLGEQDSPRRLLPLHVQLGQAYQAAGQYQKAVDEYSSLMDGMCKGMPDRVRGSAFDIPYFYRLIRGLAQSHYALGQYKEAIGVMHRLLPAHRDIQGLHKIVAMSLLALAEQQGTDSGQSDVSWAEKLGYSASLEGSVEVMYQGYLYEAQWDGMNKRVNRVFLQQLLEKKVSPALSNGNDY